MCSVSRELLERDPRDAMGMAGEQKHRAQKLRAVTAVAARS